MSNNKKSNLTLIVDGNWLLMSRLFVMNNRYTEEQEMLSELKTIMLRSINVVLRQFPSIDNIIFVSDGGSWRNYLSVPKVEGLITDDEGKPIIEYKANRVKSNDINWDGVFGAYTEFRQTLSANGINVFYEPGIEGDDWAWYWSNKLNSEGTNVIIWTKDHDLMQLVKTDNNKCFTIWWNANNGIYSESVDEEDMNFLFNSTYSKNDTIFSSLKAKDTEVTYINPLSITVDKIIRGDSGDNIQPIFHRNGKTNPAKKYRVSAKDIDTNLDITDLNKVRTYITELLETKSYKGRVTKPIDDIMEHFVYNRKLVWLNKYVYPQDVLDVFSKYTTYTCSKDLSGAENDLNANRNSIQNILELI